MPADISEARARRRARIAAKRKEEGAPSKGLPLPTPSKAPEIKKSSEDLVEDIKKLPKKGTKAYYQSDAIEVNRAGIKVDKETGITYEAIGRVDVDASTGRPIKKVDIGDDLIAAAERFIPHARVPVSKEEVARLRAKKARDDIRKSKEREAYLNDIGALAKEAKESKFYDPEEDED